ncbi:MAG: hypothetical protein ACYTG0_44805, partial [Planctomycetota bacterium]
EGRQLARQAGGSCAQWDLLELPIRMEQQEAEEASRLFGHLRNEHGNEPGVARALTEFLVAAGMLRPDGTPIPDHEAPSAEEPPLAMPGQEAAEPGKLWTPESQKPPGEKPKIWTPGMD